jgi:hydroxyacylglutathione hydrolase
MLVVRHAVVGPFAANAWLAACDRTGEAILVDPGGDLDRVLALVEPGGWRVTRIFCTHGHVDHVAGGAEARARTGAPLSIHAADLPWLEALPKQAEMFGFEPAPIPAVDLRHAAGDTFRVGDLEARVLHTPGHSAGSCSLWFPEAATVFTGDTLFAGSVGRTDLPGGEFEALAAAIKGQLFTLPAEARVLPGHGPATTVAEERRSNPFVGESPRRGRFV